METDLTEMARTRDREESGRGLDMVDRRTLAERLNGFLELPPQRPLETPIHTPVGKGGVR